MTDTAPPPAPTRTRLAKSERASALIRFPADLLKKLDARAKARNVSRNDAVTAAVEAWIAAPAPAAPKATPIPAALKGQEFATIRAPRPDNTPAEPFVDRLDKTQIGKRQGPKKGSPAAKAAAAEEEGC